MFNVDLSGKIEISRGDSGSTVLFLSQMPCHPYRYSLKEGDEIYVGVFEPNSSFEKSLIRKKYEFKDLNEDGDLVITFNPEDTVKLLKGLYYYQVKLRINTRTDYNFWDLDEAVLKFEEASK